MATLNTHTDTRPSSRRWLWIALAVIVAVAIVYWIASATSRNTDTLSGTESGPTPLQNQSTPPTAGTTPAGETGNVTAATGTTTGGTTDGATGATTPSGQTKPGA